MTRLYAASGDGIGVLELEDWSATVIPSFGGTGAHCLAVDSDAVYAGCRGAGVWKSTNGGRSWEDLHLPAEDVYSVAAVELNGESLPAILALSSA